MNKIIVLNQKSYMEYNEVLDFINNIKDNIEDIAGLQNYLYEEIDVTHNQIEQNEKINILNNQLIKMKEEDKNIFTYYYYKSKKIKEISIIMGISEIKVKSRLSRIRKKLNKELEKRGYSYGKR